MNDTYTPEKWLWTEADFERMGWHDAQIYAIAFAPEKWEITFDLDYIFQWVQPQQDGGAFSFWVAPVTLCFGDVYDLKFDLDSYNGGLTILDLKREVLGVPRNAQHTGKPTEWLWTLDCLEGEITFHSTGYQQQVRAKPTFGRHQTVNPETRENAFQCASDRAEKLAAGQRPLSGEVIKRP